MAQEEHYFPQSELLKDIVRNYKSKYDPIFESYNIIKLNKDKSHATSRWSVSCPNCSVSREVGYKTLEYYVKYDTGMLCLKCSVNTDEVKEKNRNKHLGKRGSLASNWQGGKTQSRQLEMSRDIYIQFRKSIFVRDNYTCQVCAKHGGNLEMDHIKEWCSYPELRYEMSNCRTLCKDCHKKTDNYSSKAIRNKYVISL